MSDDKRYHERVHIRGQHARDAENASEDLSTHNTASGERQNGLAPSGDVQRHAATRWHRSSLENLSSRCAAVFADLRAVLPVAASAGRRGRCARHSRPVIDAARGSMACDGMLDELQDRANAPAGGCGGSAAREYAQRSIFFTRRSYRRVRYSLTFGEGRGRGGVLVGREDTALTSSS